MNNYKIKAKLLNRVKLMLPSDCDFSNFNQRDFTLFKHDSPLLIRMGSNLQEINDCMKYINNNVSESFLMAILELSKIYYIDIVELCQYLKSNKIAFTEGITSKFEFAIIVNIIPKFTDDFTPDYVNFDKLAENYISESPCTIMITDYGTIWYPVKYLKEKNGDYLEAGYY